jgi:hypothetical protein
MPTATLSVRIRFAWWVRPYLWIALHLPQITRRLPDLEKVAARAVRGVVVEMDP